MNNKSSNYIPLTTLKVIKNNLKDLLKLAIIPAIIIAILNTLELTDDNNIITFIVGITEIFILIPLIIRWTQISLGQTINVETQDSLVWNKYTAIYLFKYLKIILIFLVSILIIFAPIIVTYGVLSTINSAIEPIIFITAFASLLILSVIMARIGLILPAYIDGKELSIKQAWSMSEGANGKIIPALLLFILLVLVISITLGFAINPIMNVFSSEINLVSAIASIIVYTIINILSFVLTAINTTFTTELYLYFKKK